MLEVSVMLRELILALADQPVEYPQNIRNAHIVGLILSELELSRTLPLHIHWPTDRRLVSAMLFSSGLRTPNPSTIGQIKWVLARER